MSFDAIMGVLITGLPVEIFLLTWAWKILARRIPENRLRLLKVFVTDAVQMVEQQYAGKLSSDQKKQKAGDSVVNLLKAAHLPVPPDSVISDLIESAVYLLNQMSKTAPDTTQPLADTPPLNLPRKTGA